MDDCMKGFWCGVVTTLISIIAFCSVARITASCIPSGIPQGESLIIEYSNHTPYERTLPNILTHSITNAFKYQKYHMDKYRYKIEYFNPEKD